MKKIVPFTKDLMFKTKIGEISSIALDNTLKLDNELVSGEFIISGTYKILEESNLEEEFKYNIPVDIAIDPKYETKNCIISIDDFSYEIINEEKLKVNISVMLDDLDIKEDPIEKIEVIVPSEEIESDLNLRDDDISFQDDSLSFKNDNLDIDFKDKDINSPINNNYKETENLFADITDNKEFSIYRVYTVQEEDTLDLIYEKFNINKEILADYNDLDNVSVGSKIIIPSQDE